MNREYLDYLASPEWRKVRMRALIRDKFQCRRCGHVSRSNDVHHKTYIRFGRELLRDLETLCRDCHEQLHHLLRQKGESIPRTELGVAVKPKKKPTKDKERFEAALASVRAKKALRASLKEPTRRNRDRRLLLKDNFPLASYNPLEVKR